MIEKNDGTNLYLNGPKFLGNDSFFNIVTISGNIPAWLLSFHT